MNSDDFVALDWAAEFLMWNRLHLKQQPFFLMQRLIC
jgi:hypothetical protein